MKFKVPVSKVNEKSPYFVWTTEDGIAFKTQDDVLYEIGFANDHMVCDSNVYQFFISVKMGVPKYVDDNIRLTVIAVLEEFFRTTDSAIVYICDTSDGRQHVRDRLFRIWFNSYSRKDEFELLHGDVEVDGDHYYASCLFFKDSMLNDWFRNSFRRFVKEFQEK